MKSPRFWAPIVISFPFPIWLVYYVLGNMWAPTPPGGVSGSLVFLFPVGFTALGTDSFGIDWFYLAMFFFIAQFPIYGIIIGYANIKEKLIPALLILLAVHLLFYFIALRLTP